MAVVALCESRDLFNLLSQRVSVSRLAEMNYLCLMDARETQDYHTSHIITARHAKTELEDVRSYPVEIIPQKVYMSSEEQSLSRSMMDDLKIKAVVCISARDMYGFKWTAFVIRFLLCFWTLGSRVLIVSLHGFRRCSAAATAYVMHHYKYSVQEAWTYVQRCKHNVVFDKRFTDQLSAWEKRVRGKSPDPQ
uniref:Uncharacterized protein n=1 Tax=Neogobius melanostomus TaxID=47308 RepID=A0A8C6UF90_9GOBI